MARIYFNFADTIFAAIKGIIMVTTKMVNFIVKNYCCRVLVVVMAINKITMAVNFNYISCPNSLTVKDFNIIIDFDYIIE